MTDRYENIRRALTSFDACGSHYWRDELARECDPDTIRALLAEKGALERDAARYRQWRDKMISQDHTFIEAMQDSLPGAVGRIRPPTADEWDSAIDATMQPASHHQEVTRG
ncbi:hypothetical protein EIM50_13540 [Pseudoxanthomonas sp. SGD-10]|nr:hypothetical protein EIM50_13540 [Pseudoxanthomonas sp. SGD-10]